jgi:hypothetical protein
LWVGIPHPSPYTPPVCGVPDEERRRRRAESLYETEKLFAEEGWPSDLVYDEKHDLYGFADGEYAFSREYANERRLRKMGAIG